MLLNSNCACHNKPFTVIDGERRCVVTGHRIEDKDGNPPIMSRNRPVWTWMTEIQNRRKARRSLARFWVS